MTCIDNRKFLFHLVFKNIDGLDRIQIEEPAGFSSYSLTVKQQSKRYARDVYLIDEEISLEFYKVFLSKVNFPTKLPNGLVTYHLTQGFEFIKYAYDQKGFEAKVELQITNGDDVMIVGDLDFSSYETDDLTFVKCKIVQSGSKQILNRRKSISVDILSDRDLDDNKVPVKKPIKMLLKSKPVYQYSEYSISKPFNPFSGVNNNTSTVHSHNQNPFNVVLKSGIDNSLSFIDRQLGTWGGDHDFYNKLNDFGIVDAIDDLTDVELTLKNIKISYYTFKDSNFDQDWVNPDQAIQMYVAVLPQKKDAYTYSDVIEDETFFIKKTGELTYGVNYEGLESVDKFNVGFKGLGNRYDVRINNATVKLPSIPRGCRLCVIFNVGRNNTITNWTDGKFCISAVSKGIDSVVEGFRYIDFLKETVKRSNGMGVVAPIFDKDGEHYNQLVLSGNQLRGLSGKPFETTFKDAFDTVSEVNCDYQINDDDVYVGYEFDFYPNKDVGAFLISPDETMIKKSNAKLSINQVSLKYSTYEQGDDKRNTNDAIHTEAQFYVQNEMVENKKNVNINQIRDAFKIESTRVIGTRKNNSTENDDSLYIIDFVPIPELEEGGFTASIMHNINSDNNLELTNNDSFNWALLGFLVGDVFFIESEKNKGKYFVKSISKTVLVLKGSPDVTGFHLTKVSFKFSSVYVKNRTDEGFTSVEGVLSPENYCNLNYSIKRNLLRHIPYLSASTSHISKSIKCTYFKNDPKLTTLKPDDDFFVEETGDILKKYLNRQRIETSIIKVTVISNFKKTLKLLNDLKKVDEKGVIGGFVRIKGVNNKLIKIYPQTIKFKPIDDVLELEGEVRYEPETITIDTLFDKISIDNVIYPVDYENWFKKEGNSFSFYDKNGDEIFLNLKFNRIKLNGSFFENENKLYLKLIEF